MRPKATTLAELLRHNETRLTAFKTHPLFELLRASTLSNPGKRRVLLACVQRFSTNFQSLLFIRQGLCADPHFQPVFLRHLSEELGHDTLLSRRPDASSIEDTVFEAVLGWFNYQMVVLDNADRAALMHLVLETAGDYFHNLAAPILGEHVPSAYFETHAEVDAGHASLALELLEDCNARDYARLTLVVDLGWNMMDASFERVRQLVLATT